MYLSCGQFACCWVAVTPAGRYLELPNDPVVVGHVLVDVVATLAPVQVEDVEPVLEVAIVPLQLLGVDLTQTTTEGEKKRCIQIGNSVIE